MLAKSRESVSYTKHNEIKRRRFKMKFIIVNQVISEYGEQFDMIIIKTTIIEKNFEFNDTEYSRHTYKLKYLPIEQK